ncbi:helix-turn-helix domain-containing protein [Dolosigranulum pigrum]|uniref:helix-turn-helix domain-containing protein n=1 Tax=Dolosigranulum pigrum TaxID=29394 RepID=UPI0015EC7EB2|nr:helix-turn-helix domain-containing protein [Dolosigranulum pigrum]
MQITLDKDIKAEFMQDVRKAYSDAIDQARRDVGMVKDIYNLNECCELLGISKNTFTSNYLEQGLPFYKIERSTYVKKKELYEFIEQYRVDQ